MTRISCPRWKSQWQWNLLLLSKIRAVYACVHCVRVCVREFTRVWRFRFDRWRWEFCRILFIFFFLPGGDQVWFWLKRKLRFSSNAVFLGEKKLNSIRFRVFRLPRQNGSVLSCGEIRLLTEVGSVSCQFSDSIPIIMRIVIFFIVTHIEFLLEIWKPIITPVFWAKFDSIKILKFYRENITFYTNVINITKKLQKRHGKKR